MQGAVLVTGATGFLGTHVTNALVARGYRVIAALRASSDASRLPDTTQAVTIDDSPLDTLFARQRVAAVIHLACDQGRGGRPIAALLETNVVLGVRLLEAASKAGVRHFINADTLLEASVNAYALSKKQFTQWLPFFSAELGIANLRLGNIYGEGEPESGFLAWLLGELYRGAETIELTAGEQLRDFVHVADVCSAILHLLERGVATTGIEEYDVGSGQLISLRLFVEAVQAVFAQETGEMRSRLVFGALPYRAGEVMVPQFDCSRLLALDWQPTEPMHTRLRQTIRAYLQARPPEIVRTGTAKGKTDGGGA